MNNFNSVFNALQEQKIPFTAATRVSKTQIKDKWYMCHHIIAESGFCEVTNYTFMECLDGTGMEFVVTDIIHKDLERATYEFVKKSARVKITTYLG